MRCEGWRRYGGAFTLGPVHWEQCKEEATVILNLKQKGKVQELPSCSTCWAEAMHHPEIRVIDAIPITRKKGQTYGQNKAKANQAAQKTKSKTSPTKSGTTKKESKHE